MGAPQVETPRLSVELFRSFLEGRPEEEHWELIDGVAVMMAPPTLAHQIIAGNLQELLNHAIRLSGLAFLSCQRPGVNLGPTIQHFDPEPDVVVIDADAGREPSRRYVDRFYLAAEIASSSDSRFVEAKREIYKLHSACTSILTVQQDRCEVRIDRRTAEGWSEEVLSKADDLLVLRDFGLACKVADLYRGTSLERNPLG
jgi:Uma2 family endonuclease